MMKGKRMKKKEAKKNKIKEKHKNRTDNVNDEAFFILSSSSLMCVSHNLIEIALLKVSSSF